MMKSSDDSTNQVGLHKQQYQYKVLDKNIIDDFGNKNISTDKYIDGNLNKFNVYEEGLINDIKIDSFLNRFQLLLIQNIKMSSSSKEFICGWGAAIINIGITFPINKIIFRQMLHNVRFHGAFREIKSEGVLFLYRGILPPLIQKSVSTSLMFGMYENFRKPLIAANVPRPISNATAALLAGTFEAVLTPFERIQTLLQDNHYNKQFKNTSHAVRILILDYGFKEYYRGLVSILLRNGPSNAFFFGLRDICNDKLPDSDMWYLRMFKQFFIGAFIGCFISSVFYPCNVLKVHVQSRLGGPFQSCIDATKEIYIERKSISGFYRGVTMNCTRSFISWGIINVSYDAIHKLYG